MKTHSTIRYRTDARRESRRHWRAEAIHAAMMAAASSEGDGSAAVLAAFFRNRPDWHTVSKYVSRAAVVRFFTERGTPMTSLLPSSYQAGNRSPDADLATYAAWFSGSWSGMDFEVVFCPSWRDEGAAHFAAADKDAMARLVTEIVAYARRPVGRCLRYAGGWENALDLDAEVGKVTWSDVVLSDETRTGLQSVIEGFFQSRAAFERLGFPWKRGVLLIGPPGTGKTMICKAAAAALPSLPFLYVRDLEDEYGHDGIQTVFETARILAPCLVAFEDLDGLVDEGNRAAFLNELDGFKSNEGLLIIASSNHPGRIDEALLKRPSRFDRVFHIGLPAEPERREYARRLLSRSSLSEHIAPSLDLEALSRRIAERTDGFTPAYLKEALLSAALLRAHDGVEILDDVFGEAVLTQCDELRQHLRSMKNPEALAEMQTMDVPIGLRRNGS